MSSSSFTDFLLLSFPFNHSYIHSSSSFLREAGCPEHTYSESVCQCAQCAKSKRRTQSLPKVVLCAHFSWSPNFSFSNLFWAAGNFMHTFSGQDRTSCTLSKAVIRNLCVLALHPVHTVRPSTGCPVPPGAP